MIEGMSMPALHRLQWIDARIRAGEYPNTRQLAERFEISRCQAQRDFNYLRDSLGAPLAYSAKHRGFYYETEAYVLPGPYITPAQKFLLNRMASYYAQAAQGFTEGHPVYREMAALFRRLGGGEEAAPVPEAHAGTSVPYRTILRPASPRFNPRPSSLAPYERGRDEEGRIICEFHDPRAFLGALLATGQAHRIEWPDWLRQAFLALLKQLLVANTPPSNGE
ncbi:MAG: hypothetical protein GX493_04655 [Firmicutes bacterium]|nr:hypothetical protein [Bacillota bacterium]